MAHLPAATPSRITDLAGCAAVFLPADPPRCGRVAFWRPDGADLPVPTDGLVPGPRAGLGTGLPPEPGASAEPEGDREQHPAAEEVGVGALEKVTVVVPEGGGVAVADVPALVLPVADALPVLTRARVLPGADPAAAFWGAASLLALQLAARGRLLPGVSPTDHDAWRLGPLDPRDIDRSRDLAAAMPPYAHATPVVGSDPLLVPDPQLLLRAFLDAVADVLPRSPAAAQAAGDPAFAAHRPQRVPEQREWAADVAAGHGSGLRVSLRIEVPGLIDGSGALNPGAYGAEAPGEAAAPSGPGFVAVPQFHSLTDPPLVADASEVWAGSSPAARALGSRARMDALLALRRAAAAWAPLAPLLSAAVPGAVDLADEEITELLGPAARALAAAGVQVHWPAELVRTLTARAVVGPPDGDPEMPGTGLPSLLSADALLAFSWRFAVGDQPLGREELDRLAEAERPLVRLRDQWVLLDPEEVRRARDRADRKITPLDALSAALMGSAETEDGGRVEVEASGWPAALRDRLADPERGAATSTPVAQPAALAATLRDYQLRGLDWLHRMTSLGLGGCLADDMGLGKTVTLIALHLHRQSEASSAGPTLVVCPTSLMSNWQREIERFAPGTRVRRFHAQRRSLEEPADGDFVLTTYGTMRLDAERLAEVGWGLVVADEAQHVKNPFSATAKRLRTLPAKARVALTGTPVENNLSELWAILDWTTPGLLGPLARFRTRYARAVEGGDDPAAAERLAKLVRPFLLRRRKSDPGIAPELPPKTETDRTVALTKEQAGLYEAVVREGLGDIAGADGLARRGLVVKLLTSLKQICDHPAQFLKEDDATVAGRSGKVELLDELLDTILSEGEAVLIFTQYVRMGRLLEEHLAARGVRSQFLHGGTSVAGREEMVRRFQSGEVPVFLLSLKAAGTGLNLTRAAHVVHFDRWWNPAVEAQATDRAYRIGQTRPVQVHRLIAEGTVEDRIAEMLARKQRLADAALGSGEAALTELTDAELADLVELRGSDER